MERRHELVLRFERDGVDPRRCSLLGLPVHAELGRERIERPLGRIAFHFPGAILLEQLRVVAEHGDAPHEVEHRFLARGLSVLLDLALRRIAVTGDLVRRLGGDGGDHHHFHERQRAGLVGADARYRPERLHRRQPPDDGVALGHALHADRERDGDDRRQALRDHRNRDADHRLEQLHEIHALHPLAVGEHQSANDGDDGSDGVAELLDLAQERRLERAHAGEQRIDAAELRRAAGRDDDARRATGNHHGSGERHAFPIPDRRVGGNRVCVLVGRHRLAGKRRLLGAKVLRIHEPQVRGNLVARLKEHDVPRNELFRGNHARLAAAQGARLGGQHVADRLQRLLGLALLNEAEQRVEDDHAEDDRRIDPQVEHQLGEAGTEQDVDQDVVELRQEPHERSPLLAFRQPVWSVLLQAARRFGRIEAFPGVGGETLHRRIDSHGMPSCSVGCGIRVHCATHRCAPPSRLLEERHVHTLQIRAQHSQLRRA